MTTQPTDDQSLKLFLAGRLKEKISVTEYTNFGSDGSFTNYGIRWTDGWEKIKDTEWLHIVWLVERTLGSSDYLNYLVYLRGIVDKRYESNRTMEMFDCLAESASWQDRAMALRKVLKV